MERLKISPQNFNKVLKKAAAAIKKGKVLICPTDTVYGLAVSAGSKKAVEKVFKIKKRPKKEFLPIFVKDIKMAKELAEIDKEQEKFLKKFWPGKITVVLKRRKSRLKIYGVDKKTIALRVPKYGLLLNLFKQLNYPLTATSANISGKPASVKIKDVIRQFENQKNQPDLVLDERNLKPSRLSTIVDLTGKTPKILRKGDVKLK